MKKIISICTFAVLLTSCYQDIDLDHYKEQEGENILTLNSIVNPDSTIAAAATKMYFYSDPHPERTYVSDLKIEMRVNGASKGFMTFNPQTKLYGSQVIPELGDKVELQTSYQGASVSCEGVIPDQVKIESIDATREGPKKIHTDKDYIITYEVTFTDDGNAENYYFLQYDLPNTLEDRQKSVKMGERDFTNEYVFQQLAFQIRPSLPGWEPYSSSGLPFSDKGINGKKHTLVVKEIVQGGGFGHDLTRYDRMNREFKLYAISKDYYDYLVSVLCTNSDSGIGNGLIDLGVSEPIKIFNNIKGGVGLFGTYTLDDQIVDVMKITGSFE